MGKHKQYEVVVSAVAALMLLPPLLLLRLFLFSQN